MVVHNDAEFTRYSSVQLNANSLWIANNSRLVFIAS